jgi:hypothetical protein
MVERNTLYMVIAWFTWKQADLLVEAGIKSMRHLKDRVKTITVG